MGTPRKHKPQDGNRIFDLKDPKDIRVLNDLTNFAGIHFEYNLSEVYVWIDLDRYKVFSERKAGRHSVITKQLRHQVYTLHYNKTSLREIARETNISTATVRKILAEYNDEEKTDQLRLDL